MSGVNASLQKWGHDAELKMQRSTGFISRA